MTGIERVVRKAGGQKELAAELGTSQQNVSHWVTQGYVPLKWVVQIEATYGVNRKHLVKPLLRERVGAA